MRRCVFFVGLSLLVIRVAIGQTFIMEVGEVGINGSGGSVVTVPVGATMISVVSDSLESEGLVVFYLVLAGTEDEEFWVFEVVESGGFVSSAMEYLGTVRVSRLRVVHVFHARSGQHE